MGAWGDSIFADDDAQEVYHHYRQLYNQGKEHAEVLQELERTWADSIAESDDGPIFWFAVARAQWEFGALGTSVWRRIAEIVDKGLGLDRWREGGPRMLAKRERVVSEFLDKISEPNPTPKKRKIEKRYPPIYQPGDYLAIELLDGTFGALIVLATDDKHDTEGIDFVGLLEWHSTEKPPRDLVDERRWIRPKKTGPLIPVVRMCFARFHRRVKSRIYRVEQVTLRKDDPKYNGTGVAGGWDDVISDLECYYGLRG